MLTAQGNVQPLQGLISNNHFSVPDFQRNYAWEDAQVEAFWNDIEFLATTNRDSHFVGSIITYLPESEGLHAPVTQLIDGQQRITTIFMLLSLIRDRIFAQPSTYLPAEPNSGLASFDVGSKVTRVIFTSEERAIPRFVANPIIKDAFHDCVLRNPENLDSLRKKFKKVENPNTLKLRKAYWRLEDNLKTYVLKHGGDDSTAQLRVLNELLDALLTRVQILQITTTKLPEAINIYMTLNNRGIGLTPADLVKSLLMKHMSEGLSGINLERKNLEIVAKWQEIIASVSENRIDQFLRHYLLIHLNEKKPLRESDIYTSFEGIIEGTPGNRTANPKLAAENVFKDLITKSATYAQLLMNVDGWSNEAFYRNRFEGLNSILDAHRIFLLPLFDEDSQLSSQEQKNLLDLWEIFTLRWVLTGGNAQIYENFAQSRGRSLLLQNSSSSAKLREISDEIIALLPNDELVKSRLLEPISSRNLIRYLYYRINDELTHRQDTIRFDSKNLHVEHIAPETATEYWHKRIGTNSLEEPEKNSRYSEYVNLIGNMSLLEFKLNSSIKNEDFEVKKTGVDDPNYQGYSDSSIKVTSDLLTLNEWNIEKIRLRNNWFVESFLQIWSPNAIPNVESFSDWTSN